MRLIRTLLLTLALGAPAMANAATDMWSDFGIDVNLAGLERSVCECYGVVKKELDRLLSDVKHTQ